MWKMTQRELASMLRMSSVQTTQKTIGSVKKTRRTLDKRDERQFVRISLNSSKFKTRQRKNECNLKSGVSVNTVRSKQNLNACRAAEKKSFPPKKIEIEDGRDEKNN